MATACNQMQPSIELLKPEVQAYAGKHRKRRLWGCGLAALLLLGVVALLTLRQIALRQAGEVRIESVYAVPITATTGVFTVMQLSVTNAGDKPVAVKSIRVGIKSGGVSYESDAATPIDFERYTLAYPQLHSHAEEGIVPGSVINPGATLRGSVLVKFPVTEQQFDGRTFLEGVVMLESSMPRKIRFRQ